MRIEFTARALADLEAAIDNYLLVSQAAAERFADEHDARTANLLAFPRLGKQRGDGQYTLPIQSSGYLIVYDIEGDVIRILALENVRRRRH